MTRQRMRCAAALLALALAGCGESTGDDDATSATSTPSTTRAPATPVSSTARPPAASAAPGPEYTQRDGLVLIEAVASGEPRALLRDLEALGLRDGVVVGRVINGWLPLASFTSAQGLATLQFVRPTGAGTG